MKDPKWTEEPRDGEILVRRDQFPVELAGGLDEDVRIHGSPDGPFAVALTVHRIGLQRYVEQIRDELGRISGISWRVDPISNFVYHAELDQPYKGPAQKSLF